METGLIACPNCGTEFEISDVLTGQIREQLRAELQQDVARREVEVTKKLKAVKAQEERIAKSRETLDEQVEARLKERLAESEKKAAKQLESRYADQLVDLQQTVKERDDAIKGFRKQELDLRKKQRELEDSRQALELDVARRVDKDREEIREAAAKKAAEEHRLKDLEKDKIINDLKSSLGEMKRKAEQGSMETQGEVLEQDFEEQLKRFFPHDEIQPVPKGIRGADLIHIVHTPLGADCGILLWETKNTKAWNVKWIPKLKDDMIETRASISILVSVVLPEGIERFGQVDGVWVSDPLSAIPLAAALREQLVAIDRERTTSVGKNEKMEMLYQYLAGTEFKQKIEGIVEAFSSMQDQLNQERRAMEKQWKQREKQIERVVKNTVGLYGDMQGIIGGQIPAIPILELEGDAVKELSDADAEAGTKEEEK